jgi:hypothetical protein
MSALSSEQLSARRAAASTDLKTLRAERVQELLNGAPVRNAEDVDMLSEAMAIAERREAEEAARAEKLRDAERRQQNDTARRKAERDRLALIGEAEQAARVLAEKLALALEKTDEVISLYSADRLVRQHVEIRLSQMLAAVMYTIPGRAQPIFGQIRFFDSPYAATTSWPKAEAAEARLPFDEQPGD